MKKFWAILLAMMLVLSMVTILAVFAITPIYRAAAISSRPPSVNGSVPMPPVSGSV